MTTEEGCIEPPPVSGRLGGEERVAKPAWKTTEPVFCCVRDMTNIRQGDERS